MSQKGIADFSPDRVYRYTLWRRWGGEANKTYVQFIGLNPSTADETQDDPTVRRCIAFAQKWGYGGMCMTNLFAFRATDPNVMKKADDPIGAENDNWLTWIAHGAGKTIACWGVHGTHNNRASAIKLMLPELYCLGLTKEGQPRHPLYLKKETDPMPYGWDGHDGLSLKKGGPS